MTEKHAVLWDMDGVLVDTTDLHYRSWTVVLKDYDLDYSYEIFLRTFGMTNPAIIRTLFENPAQELVDSLGEAKERAFRQNIPGNVSLLPGVKGWLERFYAWGYPQAIVSSAPMENIQTLIDETGIREDFQALVSALEMPSKPNPAVFLEAARLLGVPPANCLVIEDAPAGVEGARRAGMQCIAVATTQEVAALQGATLVVERLDQLTPQQVKHLFGA